jgi:hypothetical protein
MYSANDLGQHREDSGKEAALDGSREHKILDMIQAGYMCMIVELKKPDGVRGEVIALDSAYFHARSIFTSLRNGLC